jgi:hypothetical protein
MNEGKVLTPPELPTEIRVVLARVPFAYTPR